MIFKEKNIFLLLQIILLNGTVDGSDINIRAHMKPLILGFCPYAFDTLTDVLNIKTYYENSPNSETCPSSDAQQSTNGSTSTKPQVGMVLWSLFAVISPSWCIILAYFICAAKGNKMNIYFILLLLSLALLFGPIIYPFVVLLTFLRMIIKPNEGEVMKNGESLGIAASLVEGLTEAPATTVIGLVILIWEGIPEAPLCLPILEVQLGRFTKGHLQVIGTVFSLIMYSKTVGTWHLYCRDRTKIPPLMASLKSSICLLPDVLFRILAMSVMLSVLRWYIILVITPLFLFSWILAIRAGQDISIENIDHPILTASISLLCPLVFGKSTNDGETSDNSRQTMKYQRQYINVQRRISFTIITIGLVLTACLIGYNINNEENRKLNLNTYFLLYSVLAVFGVITLIQSFCNYPAWLQIEKEERTREDRVMLKKKDLVEKCIESIKTENKRALSLELNTSNKIFRFRMLHCIVCILFTNVYTLRTIFLVLRTTFEELVEHGATEAFNVNVTRHIVTSDTFLLNSSHLTSDSDHERQQTDMYGMVCGILLAPFLLTVAWIVNAANQKKFAISTIFFYLSFGLLLGPIIYPIGTLAGHIWLFYFPHMRNDLRNQGKLAPITETFKSLAGTIPAIATYYTAVEQFRQLDAWNNIDPFDYTFIILTLQITMTTSYIPYAASVWIHLTRDDNKYPLLWDTLKTALWIIPHFMFRMLSITIIGSVLGWYSLPIFGFLFLSNLIISIRTSNHMPSGLGNSLTTAIISTIVPVVFTGYNSKIDRVNIVKYQRKFIRKQVAATFLILFGGLVLSAGILHDGILQLVFNQKDILLNIPGFQHLDKFASFFYLLFPVALFLGFISLLTLSKVIQNNLVFFEKLPSNTDIEELPSNTEIEELPSNTEIEEVNEIQKRS